MRILLVIVSFGWICANSLEVGFDDDFQMVLDGSLNSTTEEARYVEMTRKSYVCRPVFLIPMQHVASLVCVRCF